MNKILFVAGLLAGFLSAPASAQTRVGDWTVEKRAKDTHCNASRGYKDKDDENRDYGIVLTYSADKVVIVLIYDGWEWDKTGEVLRADFSTDKDGIMKKSKWEVMDKTTLRGGFEFDQSILDRLSKAKRLSVDFENDEDDNSIEFETPRGLIAHRRVSMRRFDNASAFALSATTRTTPKCGRAPGAVARPVLGIEPQSAV